ncbi:MAG: stage III sporulation protein AB [Clostridia bacterium]|nr:stage III sporulation protein AB [Clostridia bacterium]
MIYKIIGSVLIICGTTIYGLSKAFVLNKRYKSLLKISSGLTVMENEMNYTCDCIDIILGRVASVIGMGEIFYDASVMNHDIPIKQRWKEAVNKSCPSLKLTENDCEIISFLGGELGMTDRDGQVKNINHVKSLINIQAAEAKSEYDNQSKMLRGLGITAGIFLVIILL